MTGSAPPGAELLRRAVGLLYRRVPWTLRLARRLWRRPQRLFTAIECRRFRRGQKTYGQWAGQAPLLVLTTTGRRSGKLRQTPLVYHETHRGLLISGGSGGVPWDPDWVLNLRADPSAAVEIEPGVTIDVKACELTGPAKLAVWNELVAATPLAGTYQAMRDRPVPVFLLTLT